MVCVPLAMAFTLNLHRVAGEETVECARVCSWTSDKLFGNVSLWGLPEHAGLALKLSLFSELEQALSRLRELLDQFLPELINILLTSCKLHSNHLSQVRKVHFMLGWVLMCREQMAQLQADITGIWCRYHLVHSCFKMHQPCKDLEQTVRVAAAFHIL